MTDSPRRTIQSFLTDAELLLHQRGVDSPRLSAQLLAAYVLQTDRLSLLVDRSRKLSKYQWDHVQGLLQRRAAGEPLAYILGEKEFYGFSFSVTPDVLIPRPETELLIDLVQQWFPPSACFTCGDVGTGSGILAVTVAKLFAHSRCVAMDLSIKALKVARDNGRAHGVLQQVVFVRADLHRPLPASELDLIVTNPPYIARDELRQLSREVRDYEPGLALDGGAQGVDAYRSLSVHAFQVLKRGGRLAMEIGFSQAEQVSSLLASNGFEEICSYKDLSGRDRVVCARKGV